MPKEKRGLVPYIDKSLSPIFRYSSTKSQVLQIRFHHPNPIDFSFRRRFG
ncbi:hypothetical protein EVA_08770 [gut metagenome]|uniref:Uncharacterized protein n=1 Tax=gut metagenome TaxID=749906 RepID=J9GLR5_9ZZZZ